MPALFEHCQKVYSAMLKEAKGHSIGPYDEGDPNQDSTPKTMVIYEGHLTALVAAIPLSGPYYTHCMNALKGMGCVKQIRRGGGSSPSQWEMLTEPTKDMFLQLEESGPKKAPKVSRMDQLEQNQIALTRRVNELDENLRQILGALRREEAQSGTDS
jgi:hypothetical protein